MVGRRAYSMLAGNPLSLNRTSGHLSQSLSCTVNAEASSKPWLTIMENTDSKHELQTAVLAAEPGLKLL